tara:strand:- start:622 stop:1626 length:1005 start_codon:yes stop_codon:yes gene_type:complete
MWGLVAFLNLLLIYTFGSSYFKEAGFDTLSLLLYVVMIFTVVTVPVLWSLGHWYLVLEPVAMILPMIGLYQIWSHQEWSMSALICLSVLLAWAFSTLQLLCPGLCVGFGMQLYYQDSLLILGVNNLARYLKSQMQYKQPEYQSSKNIASTAIRMMITTACVAALSWIFLGTQAVAFSCAIQSFMGVLMAVCPCVLGVITPICQSVLTKTLSPKATLESFSLNSKDIHIERSNDKNDSSNTQAGTVIKMIEEDCDQEMIQSQVQMTQDFIWSQIYLAILYNSIAVPIMAGALWFVVMPAPYTGAILMNLFSLGLTYRSLQLEPQLKACEQPKLSA